MRRKYLKFISQASIKADYFDPNLYFEARRLGAYDVLYISSFVNICFQGTSCVR